jgi:hypothetical protein
MRKLQSSEKRHIIHTLENHTSHSWILGILAVQDWLTGFVPFGKNNLLRCMSSSDELLSTVADTLEF